MPMTFWNGYDITAYLFKSWISNTREEYFGWLVGIFFACILLQTLEWLRTKIQNDTMNEILSKELVNGRVEITQSPENSPTMGAPLVVSDQFRVPQPMRMRLICTAIYFFTLMLSYFIMMLVMTFNVGIFATVVFGLTVG